MTNRFLSLYDKNKKPLNEGDDVQIKVKEIPKDSRFWRSNFGEFLTKHQFDTVLIKFNNHYPNYGVSARFSFYPLKKSSEIEGNKKIDGEEYFASMISDTMFFNYLEQSNILEKVSDCEFKGDEFNPASPLNSMYPNQEPVLTNDVIVFPVNDEFYSLTQKPDWVIKFKNNQVTELHLKLELDGIKLRNKISLIKANGDTVKVKELLDVGNDPCGEEDYSSGSPFNAQEYVEWFIAQAHTAKVNFFRKT